ncbi:hypothetical protein EXIGLDRAFT_834524 [Exidia glandulosa HHB12029]|uniref:Protein kinase domain-containing protein n=1 Tax=Exidia glandulosa HHB12029 TaxID=1314781 RepID=A0A165JPF2_EXIGL|nr:hypothetical protein EXIGLDRAFT_834524 [Exidia glandulosa HHB12029]
MITLRFIVLDTAYKYRHRRAHDFYGAATVAALHEDGLMTRNDEVYRLLVNDALDEESDMDVLDWRCIVHRADELGGGGTRLDAGRYNLLIHKYWLVIVQRDDKRDEQDDEFPGPHLEAVYQRAAVQAIRNLKLSPSKSALQSKLVTAQMLTRPEAILNGRPHELTGPPIGVYHHIFPKFQNGCTKAIPLQRAYVSLTFQFLLASRQYYPSETARQNALRSLLYDLLGSDVFIPSAIEGASGMRDSVHGLSAQVAPARHSMYSLLGEIKNGFSTSGCDRLEQASHRYRKLCAAPHLDELRRKTAMPIFLLSITGAQLVVAGGVFVDRVVVGRLTDNISLVPLQQAEALDAETSRDTSPLDALARKVAGILHSLRDSLAELKEWYAQPMHTARPKDAVPWPHFKEFDNFTIEYTARLAPDDPARCVFLATVTVNKNGEVKECIMKFTSRYADCVHRTLAEAGVAPQLIFCKWVDTVNQMVVIYEYVKDEGGSYDPKEIEELKRAVAVLHGKGLVHGDLRSPNVIVTAERKLMVIDCDWGGPIGVAAYPCDLNMSGDCAWHPSVHPCESIVAEHDDWLIDRLHMDQAAAC